MALGAVPGQILRMILGEAFVLAGLGLATGLVAAFGASRFIASMLFGLSPLDPLTYGCGCPRPDRGGDVRIFTAGAPRGAGGSDGGVPVRVATTAYFLAAGVIVVSILLPSRI